MKEKERKAGEDDGKTIRREEEKKGKEKGEEEKKKQERKKRTWKKGIINYFIDFMHSISSSFILYLLV